MQWPNGCFRDSVPEHPYNIPNDLQRTIWCKNPLCRLTTFHSFPICSLFGFDRCHKQ